MTKAHIMAIRKKTAKTKSKGNNKKPIPAKIKTAVKKTSPIKNSFIFVSAIII